MKKVLLTPLIITCLVGIAQADLVTFDFSGLPLGATEAQIGAAMSAQYGGSGVTVVGATTAYAVGEYIDGMHLIDTQTDGWHEFRISFDAVPISGVSFDWRRQQDSFYLDVVDTGGTTHERVFYDVSPGSDGGSATGPSEWIDFDGFLVKELIFHDSNRGYIEIDDLVVSAVPLRASVVLGAFAVGLAGRKLRKFV